MKIKTTLRYNFNPHGMVDMVKRFKKKVLEGKRATLTQYRQL